MLFIESLSYSAGAYVILARNSRGQLNQFPISSLPNVLCNEKAGDRQITCKGETSFQDWYPLSADERTTIFQVLGLTQQNSNDSLCAAPPSVQQVGQAFYRFSDGPQTFLIPVGVLMCAIFRPFPGMSRHLLAPNGLENLILPGQNSSKPEILFYEGARGSTGMQPEKAEGILNSLSWMYAFPSARRAWNSILEFARQGRLDMRLPVGSFNFYGRGIRIGDQFLITELQIKLLQTTEEPFPAYSAHTRVIEFQRILHNERRMTGGSKKDCDLPSHPAGEGYCLTDDEWLVLQPQLERTSQIPRQFSLRIVIDGILCKLSQGIPWSAVPDLPFNPALLPRTYSRMQKDGRWESLMLCLRQRSAC